MILRQWLYRILLVCCGLLVPVIAMESAYWVYRAIVVHPAAGDVQEFIWNSDFPELYRPNPDWPETSASGFRVCDEPDSVPVSTAAAGGVLFLGDSVTYGLGVACANTFPELVGRELRERGVPCRTYNAGVNGYNTFSEYESYMTHRNNTKTDLVILVTVLNDFVNPRLHWGDQGKNDILIPVAAIPSTNYDEEYGKPMFQRWRTESRFANLLCYKAYTNMLSNFTVSQQDYNDESGWPTNTTGEARFSITRLDGKGSEELAWYEGLLVKLRDQVRMDGSALVVVLIPLSFQLDRNYPYIPQIALRTICEDLSVECLDVLPQFRAQSTSELFLGEHDGYDDIWHLSNKGHEAVADILVDWIIGSHCLTKVP